jgi:hypothetical protein
MGFKKSEKDCMLYLDQTTNCRIDSKKKCRFCFGKKVKKEKGVSNIEYYIKRYYDNIKSSENRRYVYYTIILTIENLIINYLKVMEKFLENLFF